MTLDGVPVLLCFGLMGDVRARIGLDYMGAQARWLRDQGALVTRLDLPTSAAVATNAGRIADWLRQNPAPALVIAHSKGGLEALSALCDPTIRCLGFIALQSPFHGSPVADALAARQRMRLAAGVALRLLGTGSGAGLDDLTTTARTSWMAENAAAVAAVVGRLPVLAVGSDVLAAPVPVGDRHYVWMAQWLTTHGVGANDGLVPVASARLPGAPFLEMPGSHIALIAEGPGHDPVGMLRGVLADFVAATGPP
ncbi:hypothetical protein ACQW02_03655 [Humitalea sp. 24SJ18S-53]|uniref:hypothetical protein n=1 Tax=Humitalea sp. 24SJ18S-53 TaxID=3422307 RepID=UPI003D66B22A